MKKVLFAFALCFSFSAINALAADFGDIKLQGPKKINLIVNGYDESYNQNGKDIISVMPSKIKEIEFTDWNTDTETYGFVHKHGGNKVAEAEFTVFYKFNGNYLGKGRFFHTVFIKSKVVRVLDHQIWKLNVTAQPGNLVNLGTKEDPIMAFDIVVTSKLERPATKEHDYYSETQVKLIRLSADGKITEIK